MKSSLICHIYIYFEFFFSFNAFTSFTFIILFYVGSLLISSEFVLFYSILDFIILFSLIYFIYLNLFEFNSFCFISFHLILFSLILSHLISFRFILFHFISNHQHSAARELKTDGHGFQKIMTTASTSIQLKLVSRTNSSYGKN